KGFKATTTIYETAHWNQLTSISNATLPNTLDFDPTGDQFAVGSLDSSVEIRSALSGELTSTLKHSGGVYWVAWSPTGKVIATSCADLNIYLWDLSTSTPQL